MITKKIYPVINSNNELIGAVTERRIFGILISRKEIIYPQKYGVKEYDFRWLD